MRYKSACGAALIYHEMQDRPQQQPGAVGEHRNTGREPAPPGHMQVMCADVSPHGDSAAC